MSLLKTALKAVTTPHTRDKLKEAAFKAYMAAFFSGKRERDGSVPFGVNLLGHVRGDFGLGESCRLVAGGLEASGVPFSVYNLPMNGPAGENNLDWAAREQEAYPYSVNLVHLNPGELANALWRLKPGELRKRYNIAYWLWELPEFPEEWHYTFRLFDEIWTPAEFISRALRKCTGLPVHTMPYGLAKPATDPACDRAFFGLPEDVFLFMLSYDGNSVSERKNPEGAIRAYVRAFGKDEAGVGLVIKATHESAGGMARMRALLEGYPNVVVLTESYGKAQFNSLIGCVDAYVSLHRAEGFGLVMAEAMLLGTPVIATNWSANTEFMNEDVACMVDARVVALEREYPPYHRGYHWAEPDEAAAADWMRKLYRDEAFRTGLVQRAKAHMAQKCSVQAAGAAMGKRLEELRQ